jgi:hypothetical protein
MLVFVLIGAVAASAQEKLPEALETPLPQETLNLLANEVSGQMVYQNIVKLAGAPWLRDTQEFADTLYETRQIHELVRRYGIETTRLERYASTGTFDYPLEGEFWILEPEKRLIARIPSDAALIARGSKSSDVSGELIYLPPLNDETVKKMSEAGAQAQYKGKLALMWSHAGGEVAKALDAAGIQGVISFSSRERYFDPNQVVYSGGSYGNFETLKLGMTISWRQWSELLEDLQSGRKIVVRARTRIEQFPDKFEAVTLSAETTQAANLIRFGTGRETAALQSIREIYTGSVAAQRLVDNRIQQWELYRNGLHSQIMSSAQTRAAQLNTVLPKVLDLSALQKKYQGIKPAIAPSIRGREFVVNRNEKYIQHQKEHPDWLKTLGLTGQQAMTILNYVNGKRSITEIRDDVAAELDEDVSLEGVAGYLELLRSFGWLAY